MKVYSSIQRAGRHTIAVKPAFEQAFASVPENWLQWSAPDPAGHRIQEARGFEFVFEEGQSLEIEDSLAKWLIENNYCVRKRVDRSTFKTQRMFATA